LTTGIRAFRRHADYGDDPNIAGTACNGCGFSLLSHRQVLKKINVFSGRDLPKTKLETRAPSHVLPNGILHRIDDNQLKRCEYKPSEPSRNPDL
jgi:hypothetical protein